MMDRYVTGTVIRRLREDRGMTQGELSKMLHVSDKAVSKWETGQGFPDITLLEPLAKALGISVMELLSGTDIRNQNPSAHMGRGKVYVCPICGNVIGSIGEALISCHGITLPPLEAEDVDKEHLIKVEISDGEYYVTVNHPMDKDHRISFLAAVSDQGIQFVKLYPEGMAQARFKIEHVSMILAYCNKHGLFQTSPVRPRTPSRRPPLTRPLPPGTGRDK